jgi:hypothetical protein
VPSVETFRVQLWDYDNCLEKLMLVFQQIERKSAFLMRCLDQFVALPDIDPVVRKSKFLAYAEKYTPEIASELSKRWIDGLDDDKVKSLLYTLFQHQLKDEPTHFISHSAAGKKVDLVMPLPLSNLSDTSDEQVKEMKAVFSLMSKRLSGDVKVQVFDLLEMLKDIHDGAIKDNIASLFEEHVTQAGIIFPEIDQTKIFSLLVLLQYLKWQHPDKEIAVELVVRAYDPNGTSKLDLRSNMLRSCLAYIKNQRPELFPSHVTLHCLTLDELEKNPQDMSKREQSLGRALRAIFEGKKADRLNIDTRGVVIKPTVFVKGEGAPLDHQSLVKCFCHTINGRSPTVGSPHFISSLLCLTTIVNGPPSESDLSSKFISDFLKVRSQNLSVSLLDYDNAAADLWCFLNHDPQSPFFAGLKKRLTDEILQQYDVSQWSVAYLKTQFMLLLNRFFPESKFQPAFEKTIFEHLSHINVSLSEAQRDAVINNIDIQTRALRLAEIVISAFQRIIYRFLKYTPKLQAYHLLAPLSTRTHFEADIFNLVNNTTNDGEALRGQQNDPASKAENRLLGDDICRYQHDASYPLPIISGVFHDIADSLRRVHDASWEAKKVVFRVLLDPRSGAYQPIDAGKFFQLIITIHWLSHLRPDTDIDVYFSDDELRPGSTHIMKDAIKHIADNPEFLPKNVRLFANYLDGHQIVLGQTILNFWRHISTKGQDQPYDLGKDGEIAGLHRMIQGTGQRFTPEFMDRLCQAAITPAAQAASQAYLLNRVQTLKVWLREAEAKNSSGRQSDLFRPRSPDSEVAHLLSSEGGYASGGS